MIQFVADKEKKCLRNDLRLLTIRPVVVSAALSNRGLTMKTLSYGNENNMDEGHYENFPMQHAEIFFNSKH